VKSLIDRALALAQISGSALCAGLFFYWGHANTRTRWQSSTARWNCNLTTPTRGRIALGYRRRGELERSLADSQRAEELDPRDASIPTNIGVTYNLLRLGRMRSAPIASSRHRSAQHTGSDVLVGTRLTTTGDVDSAGKHG